MPKVFSGKRDVYLEVAERYERFIRLGVLNDGDKLPSVRIAAGELGVNPNTVQKAYCLLEEKGLICSLPKKGAFVTFPSTKESEASLHHKLVLQALTSLKEQGVSQDEILSVLQEVFTHD